MDTVTERASAAPALQSPFEALHWSAQDLADAVPLRLNALFADGMPAVAANDARLATRRWQQGYLRQRDLPPRIRIHN